MLGVAALATSAMDLLQSLTTKKNASSASKTTTGLSQGGSFQVGTPTSIAATASTTAGATSSSGNLSTSTMSALIDAQSQANVSANSKSRSDALKSLFKLLDGDGDGSISKAEFSDKLGAGGTNVANAEKVFAKLDTDGNGSVSVDELSKVVKGIAKPQPGMDIRLRGDNSDVTGATTSSAVNADGSTTTSITYADGSKVTSTSAAASSSTAAAARTSYNAVEQMIAKQAQQISSGASSLAISV